ncbi:hypothetical protein BGY98DRAFT_1179958 [Russula aff. rugulosa BPL654]|nr:hypothetical protein BGY98DRAFT_1179958 [Russula aff. rugulosa BPL654]
MPTFDKSNTTEGAGQQFLVKGNRYDTGLLHQNVTIETIPDDVLLTIFTSYLDYMDAWHTLVHVCQRWRYLVFASPGYLHLQLSCTIETRAREMLDVWPAFPIDITVESDFWSGVDNIVAALEQRDRVCRIRLDEIPSGKMDMFVPAMLGPFPALEGIFLYADDSAMAVVPDSFLGGSAPQLQRLIFHAIPYPGLPTLLSSARNLVDIHLSGILRSGYISPEVMVTCLSAMPRLSFLCLQFDSPESFPNGKRRRQPSLARSTLPVLHELIFLGVDEYFEDFVARIDTPQIRVLETTLFHRHLYEFSQLSQFIGRVEVFKSPARADIELSYETAKVIVCQRTGTDGRARLVLGLSSSLLPFSDVESLAISSVMDQLQQSEWGPIAEGFTLLNLLRPFTAVKVLDIDRNSLTPVASTLKEVVKERMTEIFSAIRELSIGRTCQSHQDLS